MKDTTYVPISLCTGGNVKPGVSGLYLRVDVGDPGVHLLLVLGVEQIVAPVRQSKKKT
jgi:hypothetical protein